MLSKLLSFFAPNRRDGFDRLSYYKSLQSTKRSTVPLPSRHGRRSLVKGFTALLVGGTSYLAFRPTQLFNRSSMELLAHFDMDETLPASGNVSYIRRPNLKPLSPSEYETNPSGQVGVTPAELAEFQDAETSVQLPRLTGVTDQQFATIDAAETLGLEGLSEDLIKSEPLAQVIGEGASKTVSDVLQLAEDELGEIAKLVLPIKPNAKPDTSEFAPTIPKTKAAPPRQLASLVNPNGDGKKASKNKSSVPSTSAGTKTLKLFSVNTGDRIEATYMRDGKYVASELKRLDWLMRDRRTGGKVKIDRNLYNLMHKLTQQLGAEGSTVNVISGYRSKKTNNMLRRRSSGVASSSYHTKGRAVDIFIPGIRLSSVHKKALSLNGGGVGYYPSSNFVHVDTGPVRSWPNKYKHIARKYQQSA